MDRNDEMIGILATMIYETIESYDCPVDTDRIIQIILNESYQHWQLFSSGKKQFVIDKIKENIIKLMEN